jgi:hypothetical protein
METGTILSILGILIVPAFAYLLNKKDAAQGEQIKALGDLIKLLFKKHDDDVAALILLQRQIDKEHYVKPELDARFQSLESTFREGFASLKSEFRELAQLFMAHVTKDDKR